MNFFNYMNYITALIWLISALVSSYGGDYSTCTLYICLSMMYLGIAISENPKKKVES